MNRARKVCEWCEEPLADDDDRTVLMCNECSAEEDRQLARSERIEQQRWLDIDQRIDEARGK